MHHSTTPFLSQTILPRWASRQFLTFPTVQTFLPVTFGYSLSSGSVVMKKLRRWKGLWRRSLTCSHKRTSMGPSRSWLAKWLGLGLLCWGFKGVQEEIPSEEANILQIGVRGVFTRTMHQSTTPSLSHTIWARWVSRQFLQSPYSPDLALCDFWLFHELEAVGYETIEEMKEAATKVINTLTKEDFHGAFQKLLKQVHCSWMRLFRRGLEFHVCAINKRCPYGKSLETYLMILVYLNAKKTIDII